MPPFGGINFITYLVSRANYICNNRAFYMKEIKGYLWLLATIVFAVLITAITLGDIFFDPSHTIVSLASDGGKNIYTYLYQIMYGHGFWFSGMNYPFGDHLVYVDSMPALSLPLSYIKNILPGQALMIMWWTLVLGFILSIVYTYKILIHFKVMPFIALLFAGLIGVFSPQLFRSLGHFGLAFNCVIPMVIYWTMKFHENGFRRYPAYIYLLGLFSAFMHPYFLAVILVWSGFYMIGYILFERNGVLINIKRLVPLVVSITLLAASFGLVMKITKTYEDIAKMPYGILAYCTTGEHIFSSSFSPIWQLIGSKTGFKPSPFAEGYTYLGLMSITTILLAIGYYMRSRIKKYRGLTYPSLDVFPRVWLFVAFCSLLLAMGVPFVWCGDWLLNLAPFFKQFRSLGRFSWIFYYIMTMYSVIIIHAWYEKMHLENKSGKAALLILISFSIWAYEASGYMKNEREAVAGSRGNYNLLFAAKDKGWEAFLKERKYDVSNFQALLSLKYMNIGTDKMWIDGDGDMMALAFEAGLQLHLPIIDAYISRTSWSVAEKQVKIAAGPYSKKEMLQYLSSPNPFLLICRKSSDLDPDQAYLLKSADSIGQFRGATIYACYPERIRQNDSLNVKRIGDIVPFQKIEDSVLGSGAIYVNHFDNTNSKETFFGKGAMPQILKHDTDLVTIPVKPKYNNELYEFSCWFLLGDENYRSPYFKLHMLDAKGDEIYNTDVLTKQSTDNKGLWFRAYLYLTIPENCTHIRCTLYNDPDNAYQVMDEFMLRVAVDTVLSRGENGQVLVNNHLVKIK